MDTAKRTRQETAQTPAKMGRPRKEISRKQFEDLLKINPTRDEVCAVLGVNYNSLNTWCKDTYGETFVTLLKKGGQSYKTSVRRNLLKLSARNASAAIFLAKNELGMSDNPVAMPTGNEVNQFQRALSKAAAMWGCDDQAPTEPSAPTDAGGNQEIRE